MDIIRHDDGSLTVPVAPDRHANDDAAEGDIVSDAETMTLRPGEGGYNEALAAWDQQQDPSGANPVRPRQGATRRWRSCTPWPRTRSTCAEAVEALDDPDASAEALRHVLIGGTPSVQAFATEVAESADDSDELPPHTATKIIGQVLAEIDADK